MFRGYYSVEIFDCPAFQMFTNGDDPRAVDIREHKRFEPFSMTLWCRLARTASDILDIGAHTGVYSLAAASLRNEISIHAFEPNPFSAARLRIHKHLNGFDNIIEHNVALSEANGITEIVWAQKANGWLASGSGIGAQRPGWDKSPVYTIRLDDLGLVLGSQPLVKIDVEGTEENVIRGMTKFLLSRPTILLESFSQPKCDAITAMLPGYRFARVDEAGSLTKQTRLVAAQETSDGFNQICLPTPRAAAAAGVDW